MSISVFVLDGRPVRQSRLRACLSKHPKIEFVGSCSTFADGLRQIGEIGPDAVLVGGELIELSGFPAFAEAIRRRGIIIIPVWVFPFSKAEVAALFGTEQPPGQEEVVPEGDTAFLTETILSAVTRTRLEAGKPGARNSAVPTGQGRTILIGASTGGVEALHKVLTMLPANCPPVLVVQHMKPHFTAKFVEGLDRACRARVMEAWDGAALERGRIYVAPGGVKHLALTRGIVKKCKLLSSEPKSGHRPSIDILFSSASDSPLPPVAALLTGMGRDGAEGLLQIRRAGGYTVAQDRQTSAVYGMPRAAVEIGAAVEVLPLEKIGPALLHAASAPDTRSNLKAAV